jgi:hypothetical protein
MVCGGIVPVTLSSYTRSVEIRAKFSEIRNRSGHRDTNTENMCMLAPYNHSKIKLICVMLYMFRAYVCHVTMSIILFFVADGLPLGDVFELVQMR